MWTGLSTCFLDIVGAMFKKMWWIRSEPFILDSFANSALTKSRNAKSTRKQCCHRFFPVYQKPSIKVVYFKIFQHQVKHNNRTPLITERGAEKGEEDLGSHSLGLPRPSSQAQMDLAWKAKCVPIYFQFLLLETPKSKSEHGSTPNI